MKEIIGFLIKNPITLQVVDKLSTKTTYSFLNFVSWIMQARKKFKPKLFVNFNLVDAVDDINFYNRIKTNLKLDFVYELTKECYSHTGRPSLGPVVFFKIVHIEYLENICSDRALERTIKNRLDLRLFILFIGNSANYNAVNLINKIFTHCPLSYTSLKLVFFTIYVL